MGKNWSYKITDPEHPHYGETLWSGRYCAVTGIVYYYNKEEGKYYILITQRGKGAPDYRGDWCLPCGFLEADESGEEGIRREILEETGIEIDTQPQLYGVQTDPKYCNNGNVTLRYTCLMYSMPEPHYECINGEKDEVSNVKWVTEDEYFMYTYCFGHSNLIRNFLELHKGIRNK